MKIDELSLERAIKVFEKCWEELTKEYWEGNARLMSTFCSEADIELHLAHKLLERLPYGSVHIEFPISLDVERLWEDLFSYGRVKARKYIKPDIVIINPTLPVSVYLIAELKFTPAYISFLPLLPAILKIMGKEYMKSLKNGIKENIDYLQRKQKKELTKNEKKYYLGNIDKLIKILKDFEERGEIVAGYLCFIDELYPNLQQILEEEIEKYEPPDQFKILGMHYPAIETLKRAYEWLSKQV